MLILGLLVARKWNITLRVQLLVVLPQQLLLLGATIKGKTQPPYLKQNKIKQDLYQFLVWRKQWSKIWYWLCSKAVGSALDVLPCAPESASLMEPGEDHTGGCWFTIPKLCGSNQSVPAFSPPFVWLQGRYIHCAFFENQCLRREPSISGFCK